MSGDQLTSINFKTKFKLVILGFLGNLKRTRTFAIIILSAWFISKLKSFIKAKKHILFYLVNHVFYSKI
ncbi:hypothetical protein AWQ24_11415 [Picosynechococcus sp. PCC 8807]|nr:hypothetical protein AWQ24_11415 [Picosynechococcus sp. PCC 8807]